MYQIHLYVDVSREDAVFAGSTSAGTKPIPLSEAMLQELRERDLLEAAKPFLGKPPQEYRSGEDKARALTARSHAWGAVVEALDTRRDCIDEARAHLRAHPSWETAQQIAALDPARYYISYAPADLSSFSSSTTKASDLISHLQDLVRCVGQVREGAAPTMMIFERLDPKWFPDDIAATIRTRNEIEERKRAQKREDLTAIAHRILRSEDGDYGGPDGDVRTYEMRQAGVPLDLCDQVDRVRRAREEERRLKEKEIRRRELARVVMEHGTESERERWMMSLLSAEEAEAVYDRVLFAPFKSLPLLSEEEHSKIAGNRVDSLPDAVWPAAKQVIEFTKGLEAIDPEPEIDWFDGTNEDGEDVYTAQVIVTTPIGDRTIQIVL